MKKIILSTLFVLSTALPSVAFANSIISIDTKGPIQPDGQVTVQVSSSVIDLGGATIAWSVDGQPMSEDIGLTSMKVTVGALGEQTHVTAITTLFGRIYRNDIVLSPSIMDVLWEAQTAVPPFFHGKALPSHMSIVKTLAIPFFGAVATDTLPSYSWKKDRTISLGEGVGNNSVQTLGAWQDSTLPLSIDAKLGDQAVAQTLRIPSFVPSAYFYELSPTQGVLTTNALQNTFMKDGSELSLLAVPYGIANSERSRSKVQYDWTANGTNILSGFGQNLERIRLSRVNDPNNAGKIGLDFSAQNAVNVMQLAKGSFTWLFNNK